MCGIFKAIIVVSAVALSSTNLVNADQYTDKRGNVHEDGWHGPGWYAVSSMSFLGGEDCTILGPRLYANQSQCQTSPVTGREQTCKYVGTKPEDLC
jgi:hypothetical protein